MNAAQRGISQRIGGIALPFVQPFIAILASLVLFGAFMLFAGKNPLEVYHLMGVGAFGSWFSLQNTLQRAAPLLLTALCTALPAQMGLVIIGGEGAFVMGGLASIAAGLVLADAGMPAIAVQIAMAVAGMAGGAALIALAGGLRHWRGVNETISSLLLASIAVAVLNQMVEGPMRDPTSLNKPSTRGLPEADMLGTLPGMDVHVGLVIGVVACVAAWVLTSRTTFGFAARMVGGNPRAARMAGLPVGAMIVIMCALAGAAAGLAGMIEVGAVQGRANANIAAGYGVTGILVAFLARQNPLAVIPVAVLLGGISASGGLLQRRLDLPDATVLVLQGILFVALLASEGMPSLANFRIRLPFGRKPGSEETKPKLKALKHVLGDTPDVQKSEKSEHAA
jgi:general nucleoside transport system permease protein